MNTQTTQAAPLDLSALTAEQLETELKRRQQNAKEAARIAKENYETDRNNTVSKLVARAIRINKVLTEFKSYSFSEIERLKEELQKYGGIRSNSKGGFSVRNPITGEKVSFDRNTMPEYDERATQADELIRDFLSDTIKKKDAATYRTISTLLERNKKGDYTPGRVAELLKIRDNYDDPRWLRAMELYEQAYFNREISYSASFYKKNELGKDELISLSFPSLSLLPKEISKQNNDENA